MMADSFVCPRYQQRPDAGKLLQALAGLHPVPLPLDIHVHAEVEVGVVLGGEERLAYSEATLLCRPGDVWLCGMWEPHGWEIPVPGTRTVVLKFLPEFVGEELLGDISWLTLFAVPPSQRPRVSSPAMRRTALAIAESLRREMEERRPAWEGVVRLELLRLLIELRRAWELESLPDNLGHARLSDLARIMPALVLVHSLPRRRVAAAEAARACSLGLSRFHGLFRRTMGVSFGVFGLRARLSFAAHQVLNTGRSLSAIAAEAGFVDDSHLHRWFTRQYACTPAQYRARRQAIASLG